MTATGTQCEQDIPGGIGSCCPFLTESSPPLHGDGTPVASTYLGRLEGRKTVQNFSTRSLNMGMSWREKFHKQRLTISTENRTSLLFSLHAIWRDLETGLRRLSWADFLLLCQSCNSLYKTQKMRANSASAAFPPTRSVPLAPSPCLPANYCLIITSSKLKRKLRQGG